MKNEQKYQTTKIKYKYKNLQFKQKETIPTCQNLISNFIQPPKPLPINHSVHTIQKMLKSLLTLFSLLTISLSDIRIDNNELSADGQWSISYNPNGASAIKQALITDGVTINATTNSNSTAGQAQQKQQGSVNEDGLDKQQAQEQASQGQEDETSYGQQQQQGQSQSQQSQPSSTFTTNINIFNYFTQTSGSCLVFFYDSVIADALQNKQKVDSLSIRFHDPKYLDQKIIVLKVALVNYIMDTDDWEMATTRVNYTYYEGLEQKVHGSMGVAYRVQKGRISFYVGDYEVAISYKKKQYTPWFSLSVLTFTLLTLYTAIRFQKRQIPTQKISIITLYHNIFFYIYLSTFFLIVGMSALPQPMSLLLIAGCMQILISVKLIRKFQSIIQRVANLNGYCIFYCAIFVYVWLLFSYFYVPAFIVVNSLFLVPQIVHNVRMGNKLGPEYEYLAILASPQVYFLYLKGYPQNLLRYHPQPLVCIAIILLVALQLWIVHNQNVKGPFFFIKKSWLPNYYNYYHQFKLDSKCELYQQQCAICLCPLSQHDPITANQLNEKCQSSADNKTEQEMNNKQSSQGINQNKIITLMVTPCQHKFHPLCLEEWLEYKRECPVDRKNMPLVYK